ncbi:MAG: tetratricopeptide repeat protein [Panacagrimonas sp.]
MKSIPIRLAFVAALLFPVQYAAAAEPVEEAQDLIEQGQFDEALRLIDRQLKDAPQDAEARFLRGLVLTRLSRTEEAVKVFADITRDYPQLPEPYNNLAVLYAQRGDYEKARDALEAALATHPSYATAHENLGDIYAALAGAAYGRALQLDQGNQDVRNKLAFINKLNNKESAPPAFVAATPGPAAVAAAPAPVETPAPAPAPVEAAADTVDESTTTAVKAALVAWTGAWSKKDVDGYLAAYASDYRPEGGVQRSTWEAQRRDRILRPARIKVEAVKPQMVSLGDGRVRVNFRQEYESDSFSDQVSKVVEMRDEGGWKIVREYTR